MNTPCIPTTYRLNSSGYGNCRYMGKRVGAHVAAYLLAITAASIGWRVLAWG
ncbi:HNH endonuclease motif protein [Klebsiella phage SRD2021]|uniref:HNH endonuclease motif protein n=1 Tax=Klebsiella phage SRD2021 TaxID=2851026 RepID=A0ABX8K3X5_9CAUD|nr:HNH endonuclease motif protein [Klebsiella phage SRD2021]